jgi:micrococcal nuclease
MYEYIVRKVLKVVDGDTIDIEIDLGFNMFTIQRVRLIGVDSPEIHTKNLVEKEHGIRAKEFVENFFSESDKEGYQIIVKTTLDDKYGRMLARIVSNNQCLNDLLLANDLAFPYDGGRKIPYSERLGDS